MTLKGHSAPVRSVHFNSTDMYFCSGSDDKSVKVWDIESHECLNTFVENLDVVTSVQFHPSGTCIGSGSMDTTIKIWDVRSNQLIQHYPAHKKTVSSISFHPSGNYLLSSSLDSTMKIWDLREGRLVYAIQGHKGSVLASTFNQDGNYFASGGTDGLVMCWSSLLGNKVTDYGVEGNKTRARKNIQTSKSTTTTTTKSEKNENNKKLSAKSGVGKRPSTGNPSSEATQRSTGLSSAAIKQRVEDLSRPKTAAGSKREKKYDGGDNRNISYEIINNDEENQEQEENDNDDIINENVLPRGDSIVDFDLVQPTAPPVSVVDDNSTIMVFKGSDLPNLGDVDTKVRVLTQAPGNALSEVISHDPFGKEEGEGALITQQFEQFQTQISFITKTVEKIDLRLRMMEEEMSKTADMSAVDRDRDRERFRLSELHYHGDASARSLTSASTNARNVSN